MDVSPKSPNVREICFVMVNKRNVGWHRPTSPICWCQPDHHKLPGLAARALIFYSMKKSDLIDLDKFSTWKTPEEINFLELLEVFIIAHKSEQS